jgi:hypothetical protein
MPRPRVDLNIFRERQDELLPPVILTMLNEAKKPTE